MKKSTIWRLLGAGILVLVLAGIAAPYVRADRYGEEIRDGLQRALGRKVEIHDEVTFNLFTGPGFTVNKVVIYDDPSAGIEPFASMASLEARVSLPALLVGRLEFSMVRFLEPDVNLVKRQGGQWNIVPLLQRAPKKGSPPLPEIQVSGGRLNFKLDDTKSSFYLSGADITISRSAEEGTYHVRFEGEPSRTDRAARGFGSLRARGAWTTGADEGRLNLDVELERSGIDEIATLVRGDAVGMHGIIASHLKIAGPISNLALTGQVQLEEIHRWDLLQSRTGGWSFNVKGVCDLRKQTLQLAASPDINPGLPVSARLTVSGLLSAPHWTAGLDVQALPAPNLIEVARHMGAPLAAGLNVEGSVTGLIEYASEGGLRGELQVADGALRVGRDTRLRVPQASLVMTAGEIRLVPSTLVGDAGQEARVEAVYTPSTAAVDLSITGRGLRINDLHGDSGGLVGGRALPLAERFEGGVWSGVLHYHQSDSAEGSWTGKFNVRDTATRIPGVSDVLKLSNASVELDGDRLSVRDFHALLGAIECSGEYRYEPGKDREHRFDISVVSADLAELERLFRPSLRREGNFLARTLRFRQAALPDWLRERRADGVLRVGTLGVGDLTLRAVRSNVIWTGGTVQFERFSAKLEEGTVTGVATAALTSREPHYRLRGNIQNWPWLDGKVDVTGQMATSGAGFDLLRNMRSEGAFQARSIVIAPDYLLRTASGTFEMSASSSGPQIKLVSLQAAVGGERFAGEGGTQSDGKLAIDLASTSRTMRLTGAVAPLRLEVTDHGTVAP